ncbi:MAG: 50S ribosomal protein L9 [Bacteroidia bacterium]|jgi:large subunit ribosomal protein L9|nr:50S ribosomal protein L9 [Bacteroidia bacterium]GIV22549.1 MAG: 50S ribosomal protein L9 [Bacteroidia bacterium]
MASRNIEIILHADIEGLGHKYDIVRVRPGYAWNYLIPKGLAEIATESAKRHLEAHLRQIAHKLAQEKSAAQQLAEKLSQLRLEIRMPAGKEGKLFGAVTPQQIVAILAQHGYTAERRQVHFPVPPRSLGTYEVVIRLHKEVTATLPLEVLPEEL